MALEAQFRRDSPPGSVHDSVVENGNTTRNDNREEEGSCEDRNAISKKSMTKAGFSSKHELDAGLESMFEMAGSEEHNKLDPVASEQTVDANVVDPDEEELQLVRHLTEPLTKKHLHASEHSVQSKSKKKGRKKRGASLERMIAKMILQSSKPGQEDPAPTTINKNSGDNVSTKDILSDLVKTGDSPSALSVHSKETTQRMNTSRGASASLPTSNASVLKEESPIVNSMEEVAAETMEVEELKQKPEQSSLESVKDVFGFAVDDGWMAFDDCPPFETSFSPSQAFDNNGFPVQSNEETEELGRSGPVDLDDDFEAEEEEMAAALRKEMAEEVARESRASHGKKNRGTPLEKKLREDRSAFVASHVAMSENTSEDEDKLRLIEEEIERQQTEERARKEREVQGMREEQFRQSREVANSTVEEQEKQEQNLAKELARRIAKEQEWGKLQEMAQELARRQLDEEKHQVFDRRTKKNNDRSRPFSLEEVEVADRGDFSDDEVSSLPTTQSLDSRSLSQFQVKEINSPVTVEEEIPDSNASSNVIETDSNEASSFEKVSEEPSSPSSVVDLDRKPVESPPQQSRSVSGPLAARARYRNTRAVFASRQTESSPGASRTKPTWNPKPPRHYHRSDNGL